jgi:TRAP-type C4-dicarboxylate transport system permease small subunit
MRHHPAIDWTPSIDRLGPYGRRFELLVEIMAGMLLVFIMVLTCIDVAGRYLFLAPVQGASEIIALSMGLLIFLALPIVSARGLHISVTLIDQIMPARWGSVHYLLVQLFSVVVLSFLTWRILKVGIYLGEVNETTTFLGIPKAPVIYGLAAFAGLSAILNVLMLLSFVQRSR